MARSRRRRKRRKMRVAVKATRPNHGRVTKSYGSKFADIIMARRQRPVGLALARLTRNRAVGMELLEVLRSAGLRDPYLERQRKRGNRMVGDSEPRPFTPPPPTWNLDQESGGGNDHFLLEDGSGVLLREQAP